MNQRDGLSREDHAGVAARRANARRDVGRRVRQVERPELASQRDALLQLPQRRLVQTLGELGLAGEHDRQQLADRRLHVREQTNLFEQFVGERLRLVDHERRDFAPGLPIPNDRLQAAEQGRLRPFRVRSEIESRRQRLDELGARQCRVVQIDAGNAAAPLRFEGRAQQRRLACARFADEQRDGFGGRQSVLEIAERFPVLSREEQVLRIRGQFERGLRKTIERLVHRILWARGSGQSSSCSARRRRPSPPAGTSSGAPRRP